MCLILFFLKRGALQAMIFTNLCKLNLVDTVFISIKLLTRILLNAFFFFREEAVYDVVHN